MPDSYVLRCLGQFQLTQNGQSLSLPTRKTAALLAYLLLYPEAHFRERLLTRFWGDSPQEKAHRSLRTALSALRSVLGDNCLLADRTTVQFNPVYPFQVDAVILRQQAQQLLAQPTVDPSLVDLTLYRGDLLEGFYEEWILREREELRLLYLQVLLRLAQHWRAHGEYERTSEIAQRILALDPAEEIAHQHLIFCYTVSGDRAAARQQYENCVRILREELDVTPAPETTALYQRSQQVRRRHRSPAAAQSNLPLPLASFVGRQPEIAKLKILLGGNPETVAEPVRLVTVTGPGGCGKTRLAIQVARELLNAYVDGIWWVELAALSEEPQVAQAVAKVLDLHQGVQPSLTDVIINNLRNRHTLLVLDNCEHLVGACAELAERLLTQCPALQIFTTSREALDIVGEVSWLVPSLTLPTAPLSAPTELLQFEGIRLFVERARAVQREFALTEHNAPAILQICRQLDGIPLAIELAAARVKVMTVDQLAERLTGVIGARFELLTAGGRTVLPRQQTLRATIEWSYALLNQAEQHLLQQLAVFAGGWSLEAAEATGAEVTAPQPVSMVLARLVDKSLVLVEYQGEVARYRMLETVRQYAYEQLENCGGTETARDRHLAYFRQLAEQSEPEFRSVSQLISVCLLDQDYENLLSALIWGLQSQPPAVDRLLSGINLATALLLHWKLRKDEMEGIFSLVAIAQAFGEYADTMNIVQLLRVIKWRAKALYDVAVLNCYQKKQDESLHLLNASARLLRAVDSPRFLGVSN